MEYALLYNSVAATYAVIQRDVYAGEKAWTIYEFGLREEVAVNLLKGLTS